MSEVDYTHQKQITRNGVRAGQFARVKIRFEPLPLGSGFVFENSCPPTYLLKEHVDGVETGLRAAIGTDDMKAILLDGAYHEIDSDAEAFEIAARLAFAHG
jgi:elongation factor G